MRALMAWVVLAGIAACGSANEDPCFFCTQQLTLTTDRTEIRSGQTNNVAVVSARAVSKAGAPVAGVVINFNSDSGNFIDSTSIATDAAGVATTRVSYGQDKNNRSLTVSATTGADGGATVNATPLRIQVTGTTVQVSGPPQIEQLDTGVVTATVLDADGQAAANVAIGLTSTQGNTVTPATLTSLSDGTASFGFTGLKAGTDALTASIAGASNTGAVEVAALDPANVAFSMTPSSPTIRSGATDNTSTVTVSAVKVNGVPVPTLPVTFSVDNGGVFLPGQTATTTVTTDANGQAAVTVGYGGDKSNRTLTVAASTPTSPVTGNVPIRVQGTTLGLLATVPVTENASTTDTKFLLADADGAPIAGAQIQPAITNTATQEALDFNLAPTSAPLPALTTDVNGEAAFTLSAPAGSGGTPLLVSGVYGGNRESRRSIVQLPAPDASVATVTARNGTQFDPAPLVAGDTRYGWVVPVQPDAEGPTTTAEGLAGDARIVVHAKDATGATHDITLRGSRRAIGCEDSPMNDSTACEGGTGNQLIIRYLSTDNAQLPAGNYQATFNVEGRTWRQRLFQTLTITVDIRKVL
jgi:hypothetical protein